MVNGLNVDQTTKYGTRFDEPHVPLAKNILQSTPFRSKICTILLFAFLQAKNPHPSISSSLHHFSPHHITPNLHQFPNMHQPGWCCVNEILSKVSYFAVWIVVRVLICSQPSSSIASHTTQHSLCTALTFSQRNMLTKKQLLKTA